MKLQTFLSQEGIYDNYAYKAECTNCKTVLTLYTQEDNEPEYRTIVYTVCPTCEHIIPFSLPVN